MGCRVKFVPRDLPLCDPQGERIWSLGATRRYPEQAKRCTRGVELQERFPEEMIRMISLLLKTTYHNA